MALTSETRSHQETLALRAIVDELALGPVCVKCISTRQGVTRFAVESIVADLRRAFVVDTTTTCIWCRGSGALTLNVRAA